MSIEARRHSPRVKLGETAYINFGSGNRGAIRDISDGGLGVTAAAPIQSGRAIRCRLSSSDQSGNKSGDRSGDKYEAVATIAWNDDSRTRAGLRFKTVPPEIHAQLRAWMGQPGPSGEKSDTKTPGAGVDAEPAVSLEVTGLGPEVVRSRESDERVAVAAVEILAAEQTAEPVPGPAISVMSETNPPVGDEVAAASTIFSGSFSGTAPGTKQSNLTMFPPEAALAAGYTFSSRARESRRNLLGVAAIVLLCAVAASAAALWYVYPSQARYEVQRVQDRIARFLPGYGSGFGPGAKQPITNVEPASIGGGLPADEIAGAIPESAPGAPDVTGTRGAGNSGSALKRQDSADDAANRVSSNHGLANSDSPNTSPSPDAASASEKSAAPAKSQSDTELALARTYLGSDGTPDQKVKAVQLLWLATEKGNVDAELQLADLYASGENVPKSCVQARILLKAAQVADPSAAEPKLKELDQTGCS